MSLSVSRTALSIAVATSLSQPVWANTINLEQIIVSATRVEQSQSDNTGNITVITSEQLTEKAIQTLPEALERIAGIPVWGYGGQGQTTGIYLRGHDSRRLIVLIDGVRFNDSTSLNGASWEHLMVADLERIEILPSTQVGIWGADAGAGVINMITKSAEMGTSGRISYALGTLGEKHTQASVSYGQEQFDARISLQSLSTDGFSSLTPVGKHPLDYEKDGYRNDTAHLKLGWKITPQQRVELGGSFTDAVTQYDKFDKATYQSLPNDTNSHGLYQQNIGYLTYAFELLGWSSKLSTQMGRMQRKEFDSLGLANGRYDVDLAQHSLITHRPDALGNWTLGVERIEQTAHQMGLGAERGAYQQTGYFAQRTQRFQLPQVDHPSLVSLSARYDDHNQYQGYFSKHLGLKQFWAKEGYVALNVGDSQRSPNLFERFSAYASGEVSPEIIQSRELSLGWQGYSITRFEDAVTNLIDYRYPSGYTNVAGTSHLSGWEWKAKQVVSAIDSEFSITYSVLEAKNKDGKTLAQRPDDTGSVSWSYFGLPRTTLVLQAQHTGARYYGVGRTGLPTGNFWLWHVNASYQWNQDVRLFAKGINLADESIIQGDGFSNTYYAYAPRTLLAGIEYRF